MASDLVMRLGETRRIRHEVSASAAFSISAATITLRDSAGTAVVTAAAGTAAALDASNKNWEVYYLWAPGTAGDYTYQLLYTVSGQVLDAAGGAPCPLLVWPVFSLLDAHITRIKGVLQDTDASEAQAVLSLRDYRDALVTALDAYHVAGEPDTAYALTHTSDTVPAAIPPSLAEFAAGWLLAGPLANRAAQTNDPAIQADVVSYRDMQTRRRQQGMDMMERARDRWAGGSSASGLEIGMILTSNPNEYLDSFRPLYLDENDWITQ